MAIAYNDDILMEILLRLPAKSVIRFKLVCKKLHRLISSQQFCHLHTLRHRNSNQKPSLLLFLKERSDYFYLHPSLLGQKLVQYYFPPSVVDPTILSVSNGLVLLRCQDVENAPEACYVYNLTTKQSERIKLTFNDKFMTVMGLNLAYDPLKSPHYKIVCVRGGRRRSSRWLNQWRRCQIEVYESETRTWNPCGDPCFFPSMMDYNRGVYWNNGIHWRGIFFDLHKNSVDEHPEISLPNILAIHTVDGNYVESNGHLHYIAHVKETNSVAVLELESDYSKWSLKYQIDLAQCFGPLAVLSFLRGDRDEESMMILHEPGKVIAYKLFDKRFKELVNFVEEGFHKEGCTQFVSRSTLQFIESLAPLGSV